MKILITGANGQLGITLQHLAPPVHKIVPLTSRQLDITNRKAVLETIREIRPDTIINAAAYTAVDKAESEPDIAMAVNAHGPENLAIAAQETACRLIHLSTDFVFDGQKCRPYTPEDEPNPLNVYGATKLAGEQAIGRILGEEALIIRTAWVHSPYGHNFVKTMIRLMREREEIRVVADQFGTPTSTRSLTKALYRFAEIPTTNGIHHWTDNGTATWYDFAVAIHSHLTQTGTIACQRIIPIPTSEYPTPATRPTFSILDKQGSIHLLGYHPNHWSAELHISETKTP